MTEFRIPNSFTYLFLKISSSILSQCFSLKKRSSLVFDLKISNSVYIYHNWFIKFITISSSKLWHPSLTYPDHQSVTYQSCIYQAHYHPIFIKHPSPNEALNFEIIIHTLTPKSPNFLKKKKCCRSSDNGHFVVFLFGFGVNVLKINVLWIFVS